MTIQRPLNGYVHAGIYTYMYVCVCVAYKEFNYGVYCMVELYFEYGEFFIIWIRNF